MTVLTTRKDMTDDEAPICVVGLFDHQLAKDMGDSLDLKTEMNTAHTSTLEDDASNHSRNGRTCPAFNFGILRLNVLVD